MPACFNCRIEVPALAERCYSCGVVYVPGTWRVPLSGVAPRREAWGLSAKIQSSVYFRAVALFTPIWAALLAVTLLDGDAYALSILLVLFVFFPGLHVIGSVPRWSTPMKFVVSISYVGVSGVLGFQLLRHLAGVH